MVSCWLDTSAVSSRSTSCNKQPPEWNHVLAVLSRRLATADAGLWMPGSDKASCQGGMVSFCVPLSVIAGMRTLRGVSWLNEDGIPATASRQGSHAQGHQRPYGSLTETCKTRTYNVNSAALKSLLLHCL